MPYFSAMKEHLLFRMLEFGAKRKGYFTEAELKDAMGDDYSQDYFTTGVNFYNEGTGTLFLKRRRSFSSSDPRACVYGPEFYMGSEYSGRDPDCYYILSSEGMITYIEMLELHEAREASAQAHHLATRAIWISIILGAISLLVGLAQIWIGLQ